MRQAVVVFDGTGEGLGERVCCDVELLWFGWGARTSESGTWLSVSRLTPSSTP